MAEAEQVNESASYKRIGLVKTALMDRMWALADNLAPSVTRSSVVPSASTRGRVLHAVDDVLDAGVSRVERLIGRSLSPCDSTSPATTAKEQRERFVQVASAVFAATKSSLPPSIRDSLAEQLERAKSRAPEVAESAISSIYDILQRTRQSNASVDSTLSRFDPSLTSARKNALGAINAMRSGTFTQEYVNPALSKFDHLLDAYTGPAFDEPSSSSDQQQQQQYQQQQQQQQQQ
jgi:hypothetical protein